MPKKGLLNWTEGLVRAATRKGNWDGHGHPGGMMTEMEMVRSSCASSPTWQVKPAATGKR